MSNTSEQNESQHTEAKSLQWQRVHNTLDKWSQPEKKLPKANFLVTLSEAIFGKQAIINSANTSSVYMIVHYLLRLAILVLCLVGCFAQIITIVRLFFNYPAIVFVDLHPMEKLHLPSVGALQNFIDFCCNNFPCRSLLAMKTGKVHWRHGGSSISF